MNKQPQKNIIIGRFAPSPTGTLHFGSLITALASFCLVRKNSGRWLLRIDDLDHPRVVAGADKAILSELEQLGLYWDDPVSYQSNRTARYAEILNQLRSNGLVYNCNCSRRTILASAPHFGEEGAIYPNTCKNRQPPVSPPCVTRVDVKNSNITFHDSIFGEISQNLANDVGDFPLQRADGIYTYQLATVVDDHDSGVNQVVRGRDLLNSTPRQIFLLQQLGYPLPEYIHLPLALADNGSKISKRDNTIDSYTTLSPSVKLFHALTFLGQQPPDELATCAPAAIITWACDNFNLNTIPRMDTRVNNLTDHS